MLAIHSRKPVMKTCERFQFVETPFTAAYYFDKHAQEFGGHTLLTCNALPHLQYAIKRFRDTIRRVRKVGI